MTAEETDTVDTSTAGDTVQRFLNLADADVVDDVVRAFTVRELDVGEQKGMSRCSERWRGRGHRHRGQVCPSRGAFCS